MYKKVLLMSFAFCCLSLPASAEIQPGAFTLSPMVGGHLFDGDQSLETSTLWGLAIGYNLNFNWALETAYTKTVADAKDASTFDTKVETYRIDTLYHFQPRKKMVPYFVAGLGAIYSDPDVGAARDHLLFNYGVGIKYFILDHLIALRADIRHLIDLPEPNQNLQYTVGLTFQLGKPSPPPVPVKD